MTPMDRFAAKVDVGVCMEWTAAVTPKGYGKFALNGGWVLAHRWIWEQVYAPIPEGLTIDHLCRNPPCVDPSHLEVVTLRENVARALGGTAPRNRTKTHCPQGHPYTPLNTYVRPGTNFRRCRTCTYESNKERARGNFAERVAR